MTSKTQSERVFEALRADILACRVQPGAKLRINEIAEAHEVSLGAVREALSRLGAESLVVAESQKGYHVTPLSVAELLDLTEARVEIERLALARSIERGDLDWETGLVGAWHRLSRLDEYPASGSRQPSEPWALAHAAYHQALVAACGSTKLLQIRLQLYEQAERYRRYSTPLASVHRDVAGEHQQIFEAAMPRDTVLAGRLISEHLQRTVALIVTSPRLATESAFAQDGPLAPASDEETERGAA
jgi:GntR family transcriptional regulator, carbon starvation induced regulator